MKSIPEGMAEETESIDELATKLWDSSRGLETADKTLEDAKDAYNAAQSERVEAAETYDAAAEALAYAFQCEFTRYLAERRMASNDMISARIVHSEGEDKDSPLTQKNSVIDIKVLDGPCSSASKYDITPQMEDFTKQFPDHNIRVLAQEFSNLGIKLNIGYKTHEAVRR